MRILDGERPLLTIIVPTVGRKDEFFRLAETLIAQTCNLNGLELIISDQNHNSLILEAVNSLKKRINTTHIKCELISTSYAKNRALQLSSGTYCAFLDDDCWLPNNFLEVLFPFLLLKKDGYLTNALDAENKPLLGKGLPKDFLLDCKSKDGAFYTPQIAHIYMTDAVLELGGFNEKLGVGTEYGSAEETDLLVRLLNIGQKFIYLDQVSVFHPSVNYETVTPDKCFRYGLGFGAFCKIHGWNSYWIYKTIRSFVASVTYIFISRPRARNYFFSGVGRFIGYWRYK